MYCDQTVRKEISEIVSGAVQQRRDVYACYDMLSPSKQLHVDVAALHRCLEQRIPPSHLEMHSYVCRWNDIPRDERDDFGLWFDEKCQNATRFVVIVTPSLIENWQNRPVVDEFSNEYCRAMLNQLESNFATQASEVAQRKIIFVQLRRNDYVHTGVVPWLAERKVYRLFHGDDLKSFVQLLLNSPEDQVSRNAQAEAHSLQPAYNCPDPQLGQDDVCS